MLASKRLLVSETFVTRLAPRALLKGHCDARPAPLCQHAEFSEHTPDTHEWDPAGVLKAYELAASAWYCFQPPGDTFTRRAFWDCLLAGAIPVVFDEAYFGPRHQLHG